jgi:CrcB protein
MNFVKGRYSLAVAIGAVFGALSRFYVSESAEAVFGKEFGFYGTFLINVSGCILIAYILTLAIENIRIISPELRLMTTTGFCGAYTTFSTYSLEAKDFWDRGDITIFLAYTVGSAIAGLIGIQIGVLLARAGKSK